MGERSLVASGPGLADHPSQFLLLERAVEDDTPADAKELQCRSDALAESARASSPDWPLRRQMVVRTYGQWRVADSGACGAVARYVAG